MSHVQKLKERLEAKIKEQETIQSVGAASASAKGSTAAATAASSKAASTATAAAMSKKKSLAPTPVIFLTPEEFAKKQKEDEMNEKQNKLNAKQIASKYNMTYRAFELGARKEHAASSSQKSHPKGGASGTGATSATAAGMRRASLAAKAGGASSSATAEDTKFQSFNVEDDAFWMSELALALSFEDDMAINRAILFEFFEENDPGKLIEVDQMLIEWAGREDELFAFLALAYMDQIGEVDDSAEQAAFMMFQTTANKDAGASGKPVPPIIKDGTSVALGGMLATDKAAATSSTTEAKPRRTSVNNKIALGSGGIQAAAVTTVEGVGIRDDDEEKADVGNPYIVSGVAQDGHVWKVNAQDKEDNDMIRARMLAAGHSEEEINAVISKKN